MRNSASPNQQSYLALLTINRSASKRRYQSPRMGRLLPFQAMEKDGRTPSLEHTLRSLFEANVQSPHIRINWVYSYPTTGHKVIDILKVDIEGSELRALESFVKAYKDKNEPLPFDQLLLEIPVWEE